MNPREHYNCIVLISSEHLKSPKGSRIEVKRENGHDEGVTTLPSEDEPLKKNEMRSLTSLSSLPLQPYMPPLLFPQRFAKTKLDYQFTKFLNVLKKLHVNILFIKALSQVPVYVKFLKEILSKKRKDDERESIALGQECSSVILNKLPTSIKDLDSFSIPYLLKMLASKGLYVILVQVQV